MARIKSTVGRGEFDQMHNTSWKLGEHNDCSVKAVAIVCSVEYSVAHAMLKKHGRVDGKGAWPNQIRAAINELGFKLVSVSISDIIKQYPGAHKNLKSVTTHHPERFAKVWSGMGNCIIYSYAHVSAFKDGQLHDWAVGKAMRATGIHLVVKA